VKFELEKDKKRDIRRSVKRMFRKENLTKLVVILATLALILTSILPYVL
jgi:hypothetical protein